MTKINEILPLALSAAAVGVSLGLALWVGATSGGEPTRTVVIRDRGPLPTAPTPVPSDLQPVTAGEAPEPGEPVLARWRDGNWWEATAVELRDGAVVVDWADGSGRETLPAKRIAPLRRGEVGTYALCRWREQTRFWRARITADRDIYYIDGTVEPMAPDQCVAAGRPARSFDPNPLSPHTPGSDSSLVYPR